MKLWRNVTHQPSTLSISIPNSSISTLLDFKKMSAQFCSHRGRNNRRSSFVGGFGFAFQFLHQKDSRFLIVSGQPVPRSLCPSPLKNSLSFKSCGALFREEPDFRLSNRVSYHFFIRPVRHCTIFLLTWPNVIREYLSISSYQSVEYYLKFWFPSLNNSHT